jgi:hypothetical protein
MPQRWRSAFAASAAEEAEEAEEEEAEEDFRPLPTGTEGA